jgi:hypothetical protein
MSNSYYYFTGADGESKGPFTPGEISRLAREEILPPDSVLCDRHGQMLTVDECVRIDDLKVNPLSPPAPPPPPVPRTATSRAREEIPFNSRRHAIVWILLIGTYHLWKHFNQPEKPSSPPRPVVPHYLPPTGKFPRLSPSSQPEPAPPSSHGQRAL